jgi:hypothetical protein
MAIIFSPVTQDVIEGPFIPRPRHAFVMMHSAEHISEAEKRVEAVVVDELADRNFSPIKATDVGGTTDYLEKIIGLIRGCGFGVAVFSEFTPAPTLANIFFEIGMCHMFGKPVLLAKTEEAKTPSDFVRTEWVSLKKGREDRFRSDVRKALSAIEQAAVFYRDMAEVAIEADDVDYEIAFERYRQAVLISADPEALAQIHLIYERLAAGGDENALRVSRRRLRADVGYFAKQVHLS